MPPRARCVVQWEHTYQDQSRQSDCGVNRIGRATEGIGFGLSPCSLSLRTSQVHLGLAHDLTKGVETRETITQEAQRSTQCASEL